MAKRQKTRPKEAEPAKLQLPPLAPAWTDSDSWYAIDDDSVATPFFNARTGGSSTAAPDGMRQTPGGRERRRSSAQSGAWAVPFQRPPPQLPAALAPPCSSGSAPADLLALDVEKFGCQPLLFTAPHCVNLARDGKPEHMPEDFTAYLARAWAAHAQGTSICWNLAAREWCVAHETALPGARDPNYLTATEAEDGNRWVRALDALEPRGMHLDVHGKGDRADEADLDVGVGALRFHSGDVAADAVADAVAGTLRDVLPEFRVDARPKLQGCWRSVPRRTLTQSSSRLGFVPIQLELGYALRRALGRDRTLCMRVASAFAACAPGCLAACRQYGL